MFKSIHASKQAGKPTSHISFPGQTGALLYNFFYTSSTPLRKVYWKRSSPTDTKCLRLKRDREVVSILGYLVTVTKKKKKKKIYTIAELFRGALIHQTLHGSKYIYSLLWELLLKIRKDQGIWTPHTPLSKY